MLHLNDQKPKTKNNSFSGHFANEPEPTFSESDYLQYKLSKIVTQEFVDEFFVKCYGRENINKTTPKQLIEFLINGSRQNGKPQLFGFITIAFIDMLQTYINTNTAAWDKIINGISSGSLNDLIISTDNTTLIGNRSMEITRTLDNDFHKILPQRKKKAKFKQSKFDQIKSFGKKQ